MSKIVLKGGFCNYFLGLYHLFDMFSHPILCTNISTKQKYLINPKWQVLGESGHLSYHLIFKIIFEFIFIHIYFIHLKLYLINPNYIWLTQNRRCLVEVGMGFIAPCFITRERHSLKRLRQIKNHSKTFCIGSNTWIQIFIPTSRST